MVDLLVIDCSIETLQSMRQEGSLTMSAFELVFGSYCAARRVDEAVMCFNVMVKYGVEQDLAAMNSLLSAMCREENLALKAMEFFDTFKGEVRPNKETFVILFRGLEKEGDAAKVQTLFGEMKLRIGWDPGNVQAYDALLITLVNGSNLDETLNFLTVMKRKNCLPGLKFVSNAMDILLKKNDSVNAMRVRETMVSSGLMPSLAMYNAMIGLLTENNKIDDAFRMLDEMPLHGDFPDASTYNMIFSCLIKNKKVGEASRFLEEMIKNECALTPSNCAMAISMFFYHDDPEMSVEVWSYMIENGVPDLDVSANKLLLGLCSVGRVQELQSFAEAILDRRVKIYESTMEKLQAVMCKIENRRSIRDAYENILKKRKG